MKAQLRMQHMMALVLARVWQRAAISGDVRDLVEAMEAEGFEATVLPGSVEDRKALAMGGWVLSGQRLAAINRMFCY